MPQWLAIGVQRTMSVAQPSLVCIRQTHPPSCGHGYIAPAVLGLVRSWPSLADSSCHLMSAKKYCLTPRQAIGRTCPVTLAVACPGAFGLFRTVYHEAADNLRLVMDNTLPPSLTPVTGRQQPFESECPFIAPLLCIVCHHARHKLQPLLQQA